MKRNRKGGWGKKGSIHEVSSPPLRSSCGEVLPNHRAFLQGKGSGGRKGTLKGKTLLEKEANEGARDNFFQCALARELSEISRPRS